MSVKRKVLEAKTDKELEYYLQEENKFVPQANQFAYEILKSRGRIFTPEETERITLMIAEKSKKEEIIIHKNHKKAANLIYISVAIGIINLFFLPEYLYSFLAAFIGIIVMVIICGIGYMISKGSNGAKYIYLCLLILGLFNLPTTISILSLNPIIASVNIIQMILQIWAMVLLFQIPKSK